MLDVADLQVSLPGRGMVVSGLSMTVPPTGVTVLHARNGAGSTTFLRAVAGCLPDGARTSGRTRLSARRGRAARIVLLDDIPFSPSPRALAWRGQRLHAALARRADLLLLDQPLADLPEPHRDSFRARILETARDLPVICTSRDPRDWSEFDVRRVHLDGLVTSGSGDSAPDLPRREEYAAASAFATSHGIALDEPGIPPTLRLRHDEAMAITGPSTRVRRVAATIAEQVSGMRSPETILPVLSRHRSVEELARWWAAESEVGAEEMLTRVVSTVPTTRLTARLSDHSPGERALLRAVLRLAAGWPLLPHASVALDPWAQLTVWERCHEHLRSRGPLLLTEDEVFARSVATRTMEVGEE